MVTDVSTALQLDPMFQPPSPFTVCAPSNSCDISLGDLSLPFPELFDDSMCFDNALKNAGEMLIDPEEPKCQHCASRLCLLPCHEQTHSPSEDSCVRCNLMHLYSVVCEMCLVEETQ